MWAEILASIGLTRCDEDHIVGSRAFWNSISPAVLSRDVVQELAKHHHGVDCASQLTIARRWAVYASIQGNYLYSVVPSPFHVLPEKKSATVTPITDKLTTLG